MSKYNLIHRYSFRDAELVEKILANFARLVVLAEFKLCNKHQHKFLFTPHGGEPRRMNRMQAERFWEDLEQGITEYRWG